MNTRLDTLTETTFTINERLDRLEKTVGVSMIAIGFVMIVFALTHKDKSA